MVQELGHSYTKLKLSTLPVFGLVKFAFFSMSMMEVSFNLSFFFPFQLGMRNYHLRRNKEFCPVLNLDKLWTLVSEQARLRYANATDGKVPVINIVKAVSVYIYIFFDILTLNLMLY